MVSYPRTGTPNLGVQSTRLRAGRKGEKLKTLTIVLLAGLFAFSGCAKKESEPELQTQTESSPVDESAEPVTETPAMASAAIPEVVGDTVTTASGLKYIDVTVGEGQSPEAGQLIAAHYTGWLTDGTKFDSSRDRGEPLRFPIGQGRVIKGWDEGLISMKPGGRRILIIPPDLGYADRGTPGGPIPPGATLIFDVELVEIQAATPRF